MKRVTVFSFDDEYHRIFDIVEQDCDQYGAMSTWLRHLISRRMRDGLRISIYVNIPNGDIGLVPLTCWSKD